MRAAFYWGSAVTVGLAAGIGITMLLLARSSMPGQLSTGPWGTSLATGSTHADLYTRAVVALRGLLALPREETIYYTATTDIDGRPLDGRCDYRLIGSDLAARWWSITAYGADSFLIPNAEHRHSVSQTTVQRDPDGSYAIDVSARAGGGNWLPVREGEPFDLSARF
jgi:hypothetical protein